MADAGPIRIEHSMARFPSSADAPPAGPCRQHAREPVLVQQQRQDRTILEQCAGRPPSCPSFPRADGATTVASLSHATLQINDQIESTEHCPSQMNSPIG
jgi:hypothetical protein